MKNKISFIKYINSALVFVAVVAGLFSVSTKDTKNDSGLSTFFDGINRAQADTPHNCDSCANCDNGGGDCSSANCVGGCSYSDGSSGGSESGSSDCGASQSSPGGACDSCASSGTGCGLY